MESRPFIPGPSDTSHDTLVSSAGTAGAIIFEKAPDGGPRINLPEVNFFPTLATQTVTARAGGELLSGNQGGGSTPSVTSTTVAAAEAVRFQELNDQRVIAGTYDRWAEIGNAVSAGQYGAVWRHFNYEASETAKTAAVQRLFPPVNPDVARIDAAAGGPIGTAAVLMTRNSGLRDQYYAARVGMHADALAGAFTGAYPQTLTAKPPNMNLLASRTRAPGGRIDLGNVDSYGRLQRVVGDGSTHRDHIPSKAALLERATQLKGDTLSPTERRRIINEADAVTVPADVHRLGPSYGQTASQARSDALDLASSRTRDADAMIQNARNRVTQEQLETLMEARERLLGKDNAAYDVWLRSRLDRR